jgi:hypothetical protein
MAQQWPVISVGQLPRRVSLVLMMLVTALVWARPASAQCVSTANSNAITGLASGFIAFQAATTQQNCTGRTTQVAGWIDGVVQDCMSEEEFDAQGNCFRQSTSGNAVITVGGTTCGAWNGRSNHRYVQGGVTTNVQLGRTTPLNGGECSPAALCAALGPDYYWNGSECVYTPGSPIIVAIGRGQRYTLTSAEDGVLFDIDGDGSPEQIAWTPAGSSLAFLAIDRNHDGVINSGKELLGNYTVLGATNGFEALRLLNLMSNGNVEKGSISAEDPLFERLLLWVDTNHNGISEPSELHPASLYLSEVGLGYQYSNRVDEFGNAFRYRGWVHVRTKWGRNQTQSQRDNDDRTRSVWDVYLKILR